MKKKERNERHEKLRVKSVLVCPFVLFVANGKRSRGREREGRGGCLCYLTIMYHQLDPIVP